MSLARGKVFFLKKIVVSPRPQLMQTMTNSASSVLFERQIELHHFTGVDFSAMKTKIVCLEHS